MKISLTRISPTHHRLVCVRTDGSQENVELDTKSFLFHDLLHFAAEEAAGIQGGFWGNLASGKTMAEMNMKGALMGAFTPQTELDCMEIVVGALTGAWKAPERAGNMRQGLQSIFDAYEKTLPPYITDDFAFKVWGKLGA
ncbi:MAG: hypothetical protein AAB383_03895 [Patescibacteria group bacterium]